VTPPTNKKGNVSVAVTVTVTAFDSDAGTVLKYTWDFGDGTVVCIIGATGASRSHIYTTPGNRTYTVWVDDQSGLVGHNVSASAKAAIAFILHLQVGWNMVSVPFVGSTYKASTIGLNSGDIVTGWNSSTQSYDQFYVKDEPLTLDFQLNDSMGYWVYAFAAKDLVLYGNAANSTVSKVIDVPSGGGWAIMGLCSFQTTWSASNLTWMYTGGTVWVVAGWDAATQTSYGYMPAYDPPEFNFAMSAGHSYWIWVDGTGTVTYSP
jgi:hypothetical protein